MANMQFLNMPATPNYSTPLLDFMGQGGNQMAGGGQGQQRGGLQPITVGGQTFADRLRAFLNPQMQPGYTPGMPLPLGGGGGPGAAAFNPMSSATAIF